MLTIYTYESTYEDESPDGQARCSVEVRLTYTVVWGCPARIRYDENDYPAEGDELDIVKIEIEQLPEGRRDVPRPRGWRRASTLELSILEAWIDNERMREDMLFEAREHDKGEGP